MIADRHFKGGAAVGDLAADAAHAEQAQPFAPDPLGEGHIALGRPPTGAHIGVGLDHPPAGRQHQPNRQIGDLVVQHIGGVGDLDPAGVGGGDIDQIVADTEIGDHPEMGQGIHQRGGDRRVAGDGPAGRRDLGQEGGRVGGVLVNRAGILVDQALARHVVIIADNQNLRVLGHHALLPNAVTAPARGAGKRVTRGRSTGKQ